MSQVKAGLKAGRSSESGLNVEYGQLRWSRYQM